MPGHRPVQPPPLSTTPIPDVEDLTAAINRQPERFSLGIVNPTTIMEGGQGRSRVQSPPPARPTTPISQVLPLSPRFQGNPSQHTSLPLSRGHVARRQNSPIQPARQPHPSPPFIRINTQVELIHRPRASTPALHPGASQPNLPFQGNNGVLIPIRQRRPLAVAIPTLESLRAATARNNSRFTLRHQAQKAELLSKIQPHCPMLKELCEVLCSCHHALRPTNLWSGRVRVYSYIEARAQPVYVPSAEHAHTWLFSIDGLRLASEVLKGIMEAEMPTTVLDALCEVQEILKGLKSAFMDESVLYWERPGHRGHSRWEVSWDRNEDERKHWVREGYREVLERRESMQMERRDSTVTVALAATSTMEQAQTLRGNENTAPEQTPGRERAAVSAARAVGMMNRRLSMERRENTTAQATPRSAPAAGPIVYDVSQIMESQSRLEWVETMTAEFNARRAREAESIIRPLRVPTPQSHFFDRLNAGYASRAGLAMQTETMVRTTRSLARHSRFQSRRNAVSLPRERTITWASPVAAPNPDAVNEQTYEALHFAPLPPADTQAEGEGGEDARHANDYPAFSAQLRSVQRRIAALSNMLRPVREQSGPTSGPRDSAPLSHSDLDARELARREAEQWERAGYPSTPDWLAERRQARQQATARERIMLGQRRQAREGERGRERLRQIRAATAMGAQRLPLSPPTSEEGDFSQFASTRRNDISSEASE